MKRISLALAAVLLSAQAFAQTQFPANTLWGNFTGSTALPKTVLVPNCPTGALNFSSGIGFGCGGAGGGIGGPGTTVVNHLVTWGNTTGTSLQDAGWATTIGVATGGNTNPGLFSVGWSQTPLTANRVLFTVDDTANGANGHMLAVVLGTPSPNQYKPVTGGGALGLVLTQVDLSSCSGCASIQMLFDHTASAGSGLGPTAAFFKATATGTFTPSGANAGALAFQTLATSTVGGYVFGANPFARCTTVACAQVVAGEFDTDNQINGTTNKIGVQVVDIPTSTGTVSGDSSAYLAVSQALGFKAGLQFGNSAGTLFPITSTGTIVKAYGNTAGSTVANGVDLSDSHLTISGSAFKSTGFNVSGTGATSAAGLTISTITGVLQCLHISTAGVVSGTGSDCGASGGGVSLGVANTWTALQTFSSNIVSPVVIGGTAVGSSLTLQSTSAAGTTDFIDMKVGNNGARTAMRIFDDSTVAFGGATTELTAGSILHEVVVSNQHANSIIAGTEPGMTYQNVNGGLNNKLMGFIYDAANNLTNPGMLFQGYNDDGSFLNNAMVFWRDGGLSAGTLTYPGVAKISAQGGFVSNGNAGVSCVGVPTAGFVSVLGIVTHC